MITNRNFDCIVIGAGPGGSTAAAMVAEQGYSTLLIERDKMPRFHGGESLMPECYWVLERLGIEQEMDRIGFTRKRGVQFSNHDESESNAFVFADYDKRLSNLSWHVNRAEFDQLLFDTAYNRGATVVDGASVIDMEIRKKGNHKLTIAFADGKDQEVSAKVVIDASGQSALIANRLELKQSQTHMEKSAIWGYFEGGIRAGGKNPEMTSIVHTESREAWFWYVPLFDGTVSVGVVGDNEFLLKRRGGPQQTFETELKNCPAIKRRLIDGKQVGRFNIAKDFSWSCSQRAGDGWVIVGDAGGFCDPVFGSGVLLAMKSGLWAGEAVAEGLATNDLSARQLGRWQSEYESGTQWMEQLVQTFCAKPFNLHEFLKSHPHQMVNFVHLLTGRLWDGEPGRFFGDLGVPTEGTKKSKKAAKV